MAPHTPPSLREVAPCSTRDYRLTCLSIVEPPAFERHRWLSPHATIPRPRANGGTYKESATRGSTRTASRKPPPFSPLVGLLRPGRSVPPIPGSRWPSVWLAHLAPITYAIIEPHLSQAAVFANIYPCFGKYYPSTVRNRKTTAAGGQTRIGVPSACGFNSSRS